MKGYSWIEDDGNWLYMYGNNDEGSVAVKKTAKGHRAETGVCRTAKYFSTVGVAKKAIAFAVENGKWPPVKQVKKPVNKNPGSVYYKYFVVTYVGDVQPFETKKQAEEWIVDVDLNSDDVLFLSRVQLSYLRDNINSVI